MAKQIGCPNCGYTGKGKVSNKGCLQLLILLGLGFASFLIWPLAFITIGLFIYWLFESKKYVCPECKFEHPMSVERYRVKQEASQITDCGN